MNLSPGNRQIFPSKHMHGGLKHCCPQPSVCPCCQRLALLPQGAAKSLWAGTLCASSWALMQTHLYQLLMIRPSVTQAWLRQNKQPGQQCPQWWQLEPALLTVRLNIQDNSQQVSSPGNICKTCLFSMFVCLLSLWSIWTLPAFCIAFCVTACALDMCCVFKCWCDLRQMSKLWWDNRLLLFIWGTVTVNLIDSVIQTGRPSEVHLAIPGLPK